MNLKKGIVLGIFSLLFSNSYSDSIKEIRLLDDYSRKILGEGKKENEARNSNIEKVKISENKNKTILEKIDGSISPDSIIDIYEKTSEDDIVYKIGESEPFTGRFGIVLDGRIEYYEEYKNGLLDGETAWFSRNDGTKLLSEIYSKAKLNGEQVTFYENGKIKSIVNYKNNKVNGLVCYDKEGNVLHKSIFKNGTGAWKFFWNNGNISEEGTYVSWRKNGIWKNYRKDGSLEKISIYKKGLLSKQSWK